MIYDIYHFSEYFIHLVRMELYYSGKSREKEKRNKSFLQFSITLNLSSEFQIKDWN